MRITNKQAEALPSSHTLESFSNAMTQLDLATVPEEKKHLAIRDHLMGIMADSISSPTAKFDLQMSRQMLRKKLL